MKNLIKNILKNDNLKVGFYSLGFFFMLYIFNNIADIYNMGILHRVICIFSISFSYVFCIPLFSLFDRNLKDLHK